MPRGTNETTLNHLHALFNVGTIRELTDGQLLERFATEPREVAELAFAVLVERHGPIVLRVSRSVLADPHDVQDAFQATFLVLVRKARGLWVRDSLGPWLHQVAYRVARQARSAAARRRRHELKAGVGTQEARSAVDQELVRLLHEEIERLPARFRAPLVLCDLGGRTHEQAARHLGWPVGTVKSRLSRGRERLRERLKRRGVGADAGLVAGALRASSRGTAVPPALAEATVRAAVQCVTQRAILAGSAAVLAQGVIRMMSALQVLKMASALLAVAAVVSGFPLVAQVARPESPPRGAGPAQAGQAAGVKVVKVVPGKFTGALPPLLGTVRPSGYRSIASAVEGQATILSIVRSMTVVKKGDLVCELDASRLRDRLGDQEIETRAAEAAYQNAKLTREIAQIALTEYADGIYPQARNAAQGKIATARGALQKAEGRLARMRRARNQLADVLASKHAVRAPGDIVAEVDLDDRVEAAEEALDRQKLALELAQGDLKVLQNFTHGKTVKELGAAVERARSEELAKEQIWKLEQSKQTKLRTQIENCRLLAPEDGVVLLATKTFDLPQPGGGSRPFAAGDLVHERELIFQMPAPPYFVTVDVAESVAEHITVGMAARIALDSRQGEALAGVVEQVTEDEPPRFGAGFGDPRFQFEIKVRISNATPQVGRRADVMVTIIMPERADVLSVPLQAVIRNGGKDRVAVKRPDGSFDWREVTLGLANDQSVEIKTGIAEGESVAVDASALITDEERERRFGPSGFQ